MVVGLVIPIELYTQCVCIWLMLILQFTPNFLVFANLFDFFSFTLTFCRHLCFTCRHWKFVCSLDFGVGDNTTILCCYFVLAKWCKIKKGVKINFVAPKVKEGAIKSFVTLKVLHCFGVKCLEGDQRFISYLCDFHCDNLSFSIGEKIFELKGFAIHDNDLMINSLLVDNSIDNLPCKDVTYNIYPYDMLHFELKL